jgi:hypothetical protein
MAARDLLTDKTTHGVGGAPVAWTPEAATRAAHAAGFAGTHWTMGPEELALLLTRAYGVAEVHAPACEWREEDPNGHMPGTWSSACGELWSFTEGGTPSENSVRFCHGCGKPVQVVPFPAEPDEDGVTRSDDEIKEQQK